MKLSKYFHYIELENNIYAVYNSLIMDVVFVNKSKLDEIINISVDDEEKVKLQNLGIYITSKEQDEEALQIVKNRYDEVTGKVNIMYLILSSACNLACKYCFIENCTFNNKVEINMNLDTVKNAITKYDNYLKRENLEEGLIIFYGGEPLVNWDAIVTAIELAKELKSPIKFSMVTNATLLTAEKIKYLTENNVEIGISIDGPKALNDKNRIYRTNEKSVYDEVISKFPLLKAEECKFGLSITVSEDFLDQQDEVLDWLEHLGVSSIFYNLYHYTCYDENWEEYYNRASKFLMKSYEKLASHNIYDGRLNRKIDSIIDSEFKFADCGAIGGNQLAIKPSGDVCICHGYLKTDKYVIGNVNKQSIDELMDTDEIRFWKRRSTIYNDECLNCEAIYTCGGGCAIQAEALFGNRNEIDKPFCIHTKSALRWILQRSYNKMVENEKEVIKC
ncbi:MAG: SPASM domain-containing protein [Bacilli bacterium]|nr:SPASM domain-containing protein [Bacilli bacterium]